MSERTVTVKGRAAMGEYTAAMAKAGTSTRMFADEVKKTAAALELEAVKSKQAADAAAKESRARTSAAKAASLEAKEKTAAARQAGTAEAKAEADAAHAKAVTAKAAASDAKVRANAAKDLSVEADAAAASAKREAAIVAGQTKAHEDAAAATSKHAMVVGGVLVAAFAAASYATLGFDKQMSAVGAASGATGSDLMGLRDAAIAAGQATVFSATSAAQAEEELAKAGVSVHDVLSGGLIGSLNLATAGSLDLGRAAEIAASTMTQFKLSGKDIPHIADLLAAGAGKAQGSVEDLGLAMTYVGPVAGQMNVSVEETTGALAELASNGVLADKAGTGLRGVIMAMTAPSAKAAGVMEDLGINVYGANKKFVGFRGVAEQLHRSLSGLTAQQRDVALGQIFGNEQIVAARILYAGGAQAVDDWTKKVNDSGYAARLAAARMDNLAGDIEGLKGSIETALIGAGSGGTTVLRRLTQAATAAVNAFSNLPGPLQTGAAATAALVGGVLLATGAYGTFVPKLRAARVEMEKSGRAGMAASKGINTLAKAGAAASAIGLVTVAIQALADKVNHVQDPQILAQHLQDMFLKIAAGTESVNEFAVSFAASSKLIDAGGVSAKIGAERMGFLDQQMAELARGDTKNATKIMAGLTEALTAQGFTVDQIKAKFPEYAAALEAARAQGLLTAQSQDDLSTSIDGTTDRVTTYTTLMGKTNLTTDGMAEATKAASDALSEFNAEYDHFIGVNVNAVTAQADMVQALREAAAQLKGVAGKSKDLTGLQYRLANASDRHATALNAQTEAQRRLSAAEKAYTTGRTPANLDRVKSAELALSRAKDQVASSARAQAAASDGLTKAQGANTTATDRNAASLDSNTEAGVKNIDMFGRLIDQANTAAQSVLKQTGSTDEATLAFWRQVDAIRNMGIRAGISKADMDGLLGKMLGVGATKVKPTIDANVTAALKNINLVKTALSQLKDHVVTYRFLTDATGWRPPTGAPSWVASANASGGIVGRDMRPRTDPRDTYLSWTRKGEAIITPEARVMYGLSDGVVDAMNARRAVPVGAGVSGGGASVGTGRMTVTLDPSDRALLRAVADAAGQPIRGSLRLEGGAEVIAKFAEQGAQRRAPLR